MRKGGFGFGGDADGDLGGGVDRQDGDYNGRMVKCGGYFSNHKLREEPNDRLAYAPVLELYHPVMSALGEYGGQ